LGCSPVVECLHHFAERQAADDRVRLHVDFELAARPYRFTADDRCGVRAFLGRDSQVNAVGQVVAVVEWRVIVVNDIFRQQVLPFFGHAVKQHLSPEADVAQLLALRFISPCVGYLACQVQRSISVPDSPSRKSGNSNTVKIPVFFKRAIKPQVCSQLPMGTGGCNRGT
jgi:hypothetical protein